MKKINGISRSHQILVVLLTDLFPRTDVFYIFSLVFGLGNQNNTPDTGVIIDLDDPSIGLDA